MKRSRANRKWATATAAVLGALAALAAVRTFGADAVRYLRIKGM